MCHKKNLKLQHFLQQILLKEWIATASPRNDEVVNWVQSLLNYKFQVALVYNSEMSNQ